MAKPKKIAFTEGLESVLLGIWGSSKPHLDDALVRKTREALKEIRGIYRFKGDFPGKYPSSIQYRLPKNRAGYLAAFGERHAYLTYSHLKKVEAINPEAIPQPELNKGRLVVTILGAGAAVETYGICYFYNEETQRVRNLHLNLVEKVNQWKPNRHTVFDKTLKATFPKLAVEPIDIDVDLTKDCIPRLADHYDAIAKTDVLLIYNIMNEIQVGYAHKVWKNIDFILKICQRRLLILLMEPSVPKAKPRVDWLRAELAQSSHVVHDMPEEEIMFDSHPILIDFEGTGIGLNDRLFGQTVDGSKPAALQRSIKRTHIACLVEPKFPVPMDLVIKQLSMLNLKRGKKGQFSRQIRRQRTFWHEFPNWDKSLKM